MSDISKRFLYLRVAVATATFLGMAVSHKLWLSARAYPLTPVFPFLKPIPSPFDAILFGAALLALAASAITPRLIPIFATLAVVLVVFDQSRLQPWFTVSVFLLLGVALETPNACRLIVASTFFWTGILLFEWPLNAHPLAFASFLIGIALLGRILRTAAVTGAVALEIYFLIANRPGDFWPWSLSLIAITVILFWKTSESARDILGGEGPFHVAVLLIFTLAPLLGFNGMWDQETNHDRAKIFFNDKLRLPAGARAYVHPETPGLDSIDIAQWSEGELKVPPYPQVRIYKSIARQLCAHAESPSDLRLSMMSPSMTGASVTGKSFTCAALEK